MLSLASFEQSVACDAASAGDTALGLRCHYVHDFAANIPTRDGFHPTSQGYESIAQAVFERMKAVGARR